jgi:hypothetical protein
VNLKKEKLLQSKIDRERVVGLAPQLFVGISFA